MGKKLAIIGCSPNKALAPWGDDSWDKMGVNNLYLTYPDEKWTCWSEIHLIDQDANGIYRRRFKKEFRGQPVETYMKGLSMLGVPVLMQRAWPEIIPNSVAYPLHEILHLKHPTTGNRLCLEKYFTNSVSYMIAWGILQGYTEIGIWGVDMAVSSKLREQDEYSWQRPSCEFWIGVCRGLGIDFHVAETSDLLKTRFLYGFQEKIKTAWEKKTSEIKASIMKQKAKAEAEIAKNTVKLHQADGAIMAIRDEQRIWE